MEKQKTSCSKCSYESEENKEKFSIALCNVCIRFAPDNQDGFKEYVKEKIPSESLETFRKYAKSLGEFQKKAMIKKASQGKVMSRPAFGYIIQQGKLIPAQNYREVEEIFEEFLNSNLSLRQLAAKRNFSVNGVKKILRNFTYIGKIKFNGQIHDSNHQPIVSSTLFNHVQNKLEKLGIKNN